MKTEKELTENILKKATANKAAKSRKVNMLTGILSLTLCFSMLFGYIVINKNAPDNGVIIRDPDSSGHNGELSDSRPLPSELYDISITADNTEKGLVKCDSAFTVKTTADTTADTLYDFLSVSPQTNVDIVKTNTSTFKLTLGSGLLDSGSLYRFSVGDTENPDYSYAFQTESKLAVSSYLPADNSRTAPVNTGIEITFSEGITVEQFEKHFKISPATSGKILIYPDGKTAAFVPKNELLPLKQYKVTVTKGITSVVGHTLDEDYSFSFITKSNKNTTGGLLVPSLVTALSGKNITVDARIYNTEKTTTDFKSVIYKYESFDVAAEAFKDIEANKFDYITGEKSYIKPNMHKVAECTPEYTNSSLSTYSLSYPSFEAGVYLIQIKYNLNSYAYVHVIVSDYTVYSESSLCDGILWAVDRNGEPVANADVKGEFLENVSGSYFGSDFSVSAVSGKADRDGVFTFDSEGANSGIFTVTSDKGTAFTFCMINNGEPKQYKAYAYTDREMYFSNDKINIYGIVDCMDSVNGIVLKKVILKTSTGTKKSVEIGENGLFSTSFEVKDYSRYSAEYELLTEDGVLIYSDYIYITQQNKPMYTASLSFDKLAYKNGDTAVVTLKASFFDGTPAPGLKFEVNLQYSASEIAITNEEGICVIRFDLPILNQDISSTEPQRLTVSANLTGVETTYLSVCNRDAAFFPSDVNFRMETVTNNGVNELVCTLRKLDPSKIKSVSDLSKDLAKLCDDGYANGTVSLSLIKNETYVTSEETVYNPVTKTSYKSYRYDTRKITEKTSKNEVDKGELKLPYYESGDDYYYQYNLNYGNYKLSVRATPTGSDKTYNNTVYTLSAKGNKYSVGDSVKAQMLKNGEPVSGKILYTVYSDGRVFYKVADKTEFVYDKAYINGAALLATYIDGGEIKTGSCSLAYDYEKNSKLNISISADKDSYAPGDTATVVLKATLPDGTAARGANILLSVVDEACFALMEQNTDTAYEYFSINTGYNNISRNIISSLANSQYYYEQSNGKNDASETGADSVGGNQESNTANYREVFADNPVFASLTADKDGNITYSFTVPDNITKWRLTAIGCHSSENCNSVGNTSSDVICTLPYFITLGVCNYYLTGDDVGFTARSYGIETELGDKVSYKAVLYTQSGEKKAEKIVTGKVGQYAVFSFGKHTPGGYYVTVTAECNGNSDGLKSEFQICESGSATAVSKSVFPQMLKELKPVKYPVTLVFTSSAYSAVADRVSDLMYSTYGRADYLAASYAANRLLYKMYCEQTYKTATDGISKELNSTEGMFRLNSYSSEDVILTAKVCLTAPEAMSDARKASAATALKAYISGRKYNNSTEMCAAYAALAAIGEPVLCDLYLLQEISEDLTDEGIIYLSAAFAAIGDYNSSRVINESIKQAHIKSDEDGTYYSADSREEKIRLTSLCLFAFSRCDHDTATQFEEFLSNHSSDYDLYRAERATLLRFFKPEPIEKSELTYSVNGVETKIEISGSNKYRITLGYDEFESFDIIKSDGIGIFASYFATYQDALINSTEEKELKLDKTIEIYDAKQSIYKVTVSYEINTDKDNINFRLTDTIPAGAMYFGGEYRSNPSNINCHGGGYLYSSGTRNMTGNIYLYPEYENINGVYVKTEGNRRLSGTIIYYIRVAAPGEYVIEPAVAINADDGTYKMTGQGQIEFTAR